MNTTNLIDEIRIKLALAESTEQHLRSAENALVEKDAKIDELEHTLDRRENVILSVGKRNISLHKAYRRMSKLAHYYKQATKDVVSVNQQLSDRVVELTEELNNKPALLELKIHVLENEKKELAEELARYKALLKDIKGTVNSMC